MSMTVTRIIVFATLLASLLAACGSEELFVGAFLDGGGLPDPDAGARNADAGGNVDAGTNGDAGDTDAEPPCVGKTAQPVDRTLTITSGGQQRTAAIHVPAKYVTDKRTPLVFDLHDVTSSATSQDTISAMNAKADAVGFVSVHPTGTNASWNGGACCGQAASSNLDDVGFVRDLIDVLSVDLCLDRRRIFATGIGNGAFLAHRLACELADRIAAVAPVAGVVGVTACKPARPISVLAVHGTADAVFPYNGNTGLGYPAVSQVFADWATRDGCVGTPTETFRKIDASCSSYEACGGGTVVTQCTIDNGGHTWPGSSAPTLGGYVSPHLNTTDILWQFFAAHPMP